MRIALALALAFLLVFAPSPASADPRPVVAVAAASAAALPTPPPEVATDSPRASVKRFLDLARAGEYADASEYLDLSEANKPQGSLLARHLAAVLDRQLFGGLDELSPLSLGKRSDKLPPGVEEIASLQGPNGLEPVRLVRRATPDGTRWIFSRSTVERIEGWYSRLQDRWLLEYLPQPLLRLGPKDLTWWQWIALPIFFAAALGVGKVLGYATRRALGRLTARTRAQWDDLLLTRLAPPLTFVWALVAMELVSPWLGLYPPAEAFLDRVLHAGFLLALFWIAVRGIDVAGERLLDRSADRGNPAARSLVPLGARFVKIAATAMAVIAVLSELGYPVTSLLAGLGIGGVAVALAAQKTVENLFGSLSIGVDQPFRIGDFITVDTISGSVESIGLRSTRIRTLDRTLVTIPNGKLADMRVESFAQRDRIRFTCVLGLVRHTKATAVREVLTGARELLLGHPKIWPGPTVALVKISDTSLDVEITAWFETTDGDEFIRIREETLLSLLEIVERAGAELSYPTRTVHMAAGELPTSTPDLAPSGTC